jgi:hypothetical protein
MGPLELEATVERRHSGQVAWRSSDPPDRLQARPIAEADLRWYFGDAAGELGLRGMSLEPTSGSGDGVAAAARQTLAYVRFRDVRRALLALSSDDRRVLALAYTERRSPPNDPLAGWHEKAGVAAWLIARTEQARVAVDRRSLARLALEQRKYQVPVEVRVGRVELGGQPFVRPVRPPVGKHARDELRVAR